MIFVCAATHKTKVSLKNKIHMFTLNFYELDLETSDMCGFFVTDFAYVDFSSSSPCSFSYFKQNKEIYSSVPWKQMMKW